MARQASLRLFGGFRLQDAEGKAIRLPLRKAEALLAYLVCAPDRSVARETLAALLWGDRDQRRARRSLRQAAFKLRQALARHGVSALCQDGPQLALEFDVLWVDVIEFERLRAAGSAADMARAGALYGGEFLAGLEIAAPAFEEWLLVARTRFRDAAVAALGVAFEQQRRSGQSARAIQTARRVLEIEPYREDFHRHLMELHAAVGQRSAALAQYARCRDLLRDDLGVVPDDASEALYRRLLEQGREEGSAPAPPGPGLRPLGLAETRGTPPEFARVTVGRRDELAVLDAEFGRALEAGARAVVVSGEAGVGKSHLLAEFARALSGNGAALHWGRARRGERLLPLALWSDLADHFPAPAGRAGVAQGSVPLASRRSEPDDEPGPDWRRVYEPTVRRLQAAARDNPLAILLEDLHWADGESLRLLAYALRRLSESPVLFLASARTDEPGAGARLWRALHDAGRGGRTRHLPLQPLSRHETATLVRHHQAGLGAAPVSKARLAEIWALSEGNPGLVLAALAQAGAGGGSEDQVNGTLPDIVREEVDRVRSRLSETGHTLATAASVLGRRCDFRILRQAAGLGEPEAVRALEELEAARVLRVAGDQVAFVRRRVRRGLLEASLGPRRRAVHRVAACAIRRLHAGGLAPHCQALGRHYRQAGLVADALDFELRAAEVSLSRGQHGAARRLLRRVLEAGQALEPDGAARTRQARARVALAAVAEAERDLDAAHEVLHPLEGQLGRLGARERAEALCALARLHHGRGDEDRAYAYARRALRESEAVGAHHPWLPAEAVLFRLHVLALAPERALGRAARARQKARDLALPRDEADARATLALLHAMRGELATALGEATAAAGLAETLPEPRRLAGYLQLVGLVHLWAGAAGPALEWLARADEIAKACPDPLRIFALRGHRGRALWLAGQPEDARVELARALELGDRLGARCYLALFAAWLAEAELDAGRPGAALDQARRAISSAGLTNQPWPGAVALRVLARVLSQADFGNLAAAERAAARAAAELAGLGLEVERVPALRVWAHVLRAQGHRSEARRLSEAAARLSDQLETKFAPACARLSIERRHAGSRRARK